MISAQMGRSISDKRELGIEESWDKRAFLNKIIIFMIFVFPALYFYQDINSNARQGINVWKALLSGNFFKYYSINVESQMAGEMLDPANYGMFLNILNGIWMLPAFIAEAVSGKSDIMNLPITKIWASLQPIFYVWISYDALRKLSDTVGLPLARAKRMLFMYVTGTIVVSSAGMRGQLDVVGLSFLLYSINHLICNNRRKFLIYATMAVLCKSFPVFIVIPLVLLTEKCVWKAAMESVVPIFASFLIELPFSIIDALGVASKRPRIWLMFDRMTRNCVEIMGHKVPVMFIAIAVVFMGAYLMHEKNGKERIERIIYISFIGILPIVLCMISYLQWLIYFYPFLLLLIFMKREDLERSVLLEAVASLSLLGGFLVYEIPTFGLDNKRGTVWEYIFQLDRPRRFSLENISAYIMRDEHFGAYTFAYSIFFVWVIGAVVLFHPIISKRLLQQEENLEIDELHLTDRWLYMRAIAVFILINSSTLCSCEIKK